MHFVTAPHVSIGVVRDLGYVRLEQMTTSLILSPYFHSNFNRTKVRRLMKTGHRIVEKFSQDKIFVDGSKNENLRIKFADAVYTDSICENLQILFSWMLG